MQPEALLLDEPTSSLDPDTKKEIVDVIVDLAGGGALTMVIVTHEAAFIERIATRVIQLGPKCTVLSDVKK
jgi:ABC-type polar amino acid transport system ATPase subunit